MMVPEINLTPRLEARFRERFAAMTWSPQHFQARRPPSGSQHWLAAHRARAMVLGTHIGLHAHAPAGGPIVVDEERDPSCKSQDGARYSAKDLAILRATHADRTVLLGSSRTVAGKLAPGRRRTLPSPGHARSRVGGESMPRVGHDRRDACAQGNPIAEH